MSLKNAREAQHLSIDFVAKTLHIDKSRYIQYEEGSLPIPDDDLQRILKLLGMDDLGETCRLAENDREALGKLASVYRRINSQR